LFRRYRSSHDLLSSIKDLVAANPRANPQEVLDEIARQLSEGRGYGWIGIYLAASDALASQGSRGPAPPDRSAESTSKWVQPIKVGTRVLGAIEVESEPLGKERALLEQVSELLARYLTTDRGKLLLRKAREKSHLPAPAAEPHKGPQSARPGISRAAAGKQVIG
jgi:putative methionine-R-sulfoxide reductase with GAF domain